MKRRSLLNLLGLTLGFPAASAIAQPAAGRPLRIILVLPAGASIDVQTRMLAPYLSASLGQPVIIENKPGANGLIGMQELIRSAPDGNTVLLGSLSPLAVNVALVKNLPYDPRRDLTAIAGFFVSHHVLLVKSSSPLQTLQDYIAYAKQNPGKMSIGHSTSVVQAQIATLQKMAGIDLLAVPYKGTPPTITDVLGGTLDSTLLDPGNAIPHVKSGAMRALAVTSVKRSPLTPDWPAISETYPGFDFSSWTAMVGPPGMPRNAVNRLNAAMNSALAQKEVVEKFHQASAVPMPMTPDQLKAYIEAETNKWVRVARESNIQAE